MTSARFNSQGVKSSFEELESAVKRFFAVFPTEEHCLKYLYERLKRGSACRCTSCGNTEFDESCDERFTICAKCGQLWWITAGTFFSHVRNLRTWCLAIWLIEQGVEFNANQLSKIANSAYASVHSMVAKLNFVIAREMNNCTEVASQTFESLFSRRTCETPAREHPRSEEREALRQASRDSFGSKGVDNSQRGPHSTNETDEDKVCDGDIVCDNTPNPMDIAAAGAHDVENLDPELRGILSLFCQNDYLHFDKLSEKSGLPAGVLLGHLAMLEVDGLVSYRPGDWYGLAKRRAFATQPQESLPEIEMMVAKFETFIRNTSQTIGRKYVQLYLALYWAVVDKSRWGENALLDACLNSPEITDYQIRQYVSPVTLRMGNSS